jgi:serine/threonine protein kinase
LFTRIREAYVTEIEIRCPKCGESVAAMLDGGGVSGWVCEHCGEMMSREDPGVMKTPSSDPLVSGRIGSLEIREKLGLGGIGTVYRAWDDKLEREVAVKVVHRSMASNPEFVKNYIREMIGVAQLNHPNIVHVHQVARDEELDLHYLVMEWLDRETLRNRIERVGPLPIDSAMDIALQCVDGLSAAHQKGIFHGDVKPGNILFDDSGGVKITDFGLAGTAARGERAKVVGTPFYMSPERFEGSPVDEQSDIYSLGVTLYYTLSGALPHQGTTPIEVLNSIIANEPRPLTDLVPDLPDGVRQLIEKMIAKDRGERYADLGQVRRDLLALAGGSRPEPVICAFCGESNTGGGKTCCECGRVLEARPDAAELTSRVRGYLGFGQFALAISTLSERSVLAALDSSTASVVTRSLAALQAELTTTLLDLVERAMREGDFSLAARHHETLMRVAAEDHPDRERISAAQRRIDDFRARQRAAADPLIGHRLGHWVIEENRGEGAFGQVYRALNVRLQQPVAIKILKRQFVSSPKALELFRREARAAAKLDHPGIIRIYGLEFDEATANHFLVLEYVDGRDLDEVLRSQPEARLPLDFTLQVIRSSAEALEQAHEAGILHRDIKPGNVMVLPGGQVKVGDFGLAREVDSDPTTTLKGTPPYMSPEQWNSKEDHRTDIYALGVSIYHLLSGKYPFPGTGYQIAMKVMTSDPVPLSEVRPDLPAEVSEFVGRMIAKLPDRRPQSMGEVAAEITTLAEKLSLDLDTVADRHRRIFSGDHPPEEEPEAPAETRTPG